MHNCARLSRSSVLQAILLTLWLPLLDCFLGVHTRTSSSTSTGVLSRPLQRFVLIPVVLGSNDFRAKHELPGAAKCPLGAASAELGTVQECAVRIQHGCKLAQALNFVAGATKVIHPLQSTIEPQHVQRTVRDVPLSPSDLCSPKSLDLGAKLWSPKSRTAEARY